MIHGAAITYFLRKNAEVPAPAPQVSAPRRALPVAEEAIDSVSDRITVDETVKLREAGEEVILLDIRADRNRRNSQTQAAGSIRVHPHDPVQDAKALQLSKRATLVVYCA